MIKKKTYLSNFIKPAKKILVILLISAWIFSGYPQLGSFPPKAQEVKAQAVECGFGEDIGGGWCQGFLDGVAGSNQTWNVPEDWTDNNTIECIGGGGGGSTGLSGGGGNGGGGGGGGAYAKSTSLTGITPGGTVTYRLGTGGGANTAGGDTWFNDTALPSSGYACGAVGGSSATAGTISGSSGGLAVDSYAIGTASSTYSGGNGADGVAGGGTQVGGGAGGSAGPNGIGGHAVGTTGGDGGGGLGGAGGTVGSPGEAGAEYTTHGSGGGGGGATAGANNGGTGGAYGAGGGGGGKSNQAGGAGGAGNQGLIVVTYEALVINLPTIFTYSPTNITVNSADGQGEITNDGGADILSRGFVVATGSVALSDPGNTDPEVQTIYSLKYYDSATGTSEFSVLLSGLESDTNYRYRAFAENSEGFSYGADFGFSTLVIAPTLSSPTGSATGTSTASGSVTTDQDNGNLYWVITESTTSPTEAQVKAGQDHTGASAVATGTQSVTLTGVQNVSATGLTADTTYYFHFMHENSDNQQSNVSTSNSFITDDIKLNPRLIQDSFRVYENRDNQTPLIALSDENNRALNITQNEAIRFRINTRIEDGPLEAGGLSVELQYALLEGESGCSGVASSSYSTVGDIGSVAIWRGFSNPSVTSGTTLNDLLLSNSNVAGSYEEQNPSVVNPNEVGVGERLEWDFVAQNNNAQSDEVYCFRLTEVGGEVFFGYESYAEVKVIRGLVQVRYRWRNDDGTE